MTDTRAKLSIDEVMDKTRALRAELQTLIVECACCQVLHEALQLGAPAENLNLMHNQIIVIHDALHKLLEPPEPGGEAPSPSTTLH